MPRDAVRIADLIFEAVWRASSDELFVHRAACRASDDRKPALLIRNGIDPRELYERIEREFEGGITALHDTSEKKVPEVPAAGQPCVSEEAALL